MALEDFEKELERERSERQKRQRHGSRSPDHERRKRHRHRHRQQSADRQGNAGEHRHQHHRKHRSRHQRHDGDADPVETGQPDRELANRKSPEKWDTQNASQLGPTNQERDSWMQNPTALEVEYIQRRQGHLPQSQYVEATLPDQALPSNGESEDDDENKGTNSHMQEHSVTSPDNVNYVFGDAGSSWRMTKLQAIRREAEHTGQSLEDIALDRYGSLNSFYHALEEENELDRRERYGAGRQNIDRPTGELFKQRNPNKSHIKPQNDSTNILENGEPQVLAAGANDSQFSAEPLDQTSLNKLKARALKARMQKATNAAEIEAEYEDAMKVVLNGTKAADTIVLNKMEARLLAGDRSGEIRQIQNKRGQERQLVEENENMSIEDMVRNERRTRHQRGGEGRAFADKIAKDSKFDNDLDYLDENASRLAKTAQRSEINLRTTAINEYQKTKRILDKCPLCHHEDTGQSPQAPVVSLATRVYLTLPTSPEITPYGLCATIVPIEHRFNLLECDDDEWEEIRNFMKSLTHFYWSQKPRMSVIFYENAAHEGRKRHASLEAIPLAADMTSTAPAFFREAILASDEEWSQHKKIIDTLSVANGGLGKMAFRSSMVSNLPYFHVWLTLDGGLGHIVEDTRRWPKGDLFAREVLGGMLDVSPDIIRRQGRWQSNDSQLSSRVRNFRRDWQHWDWTEALAVKT